VRGGSSGFGELGGFRCVALPWLAGEAQHVFSIGCFGRLVLLKMVLLSATYMLNKFHEYALSCIVLFYRRTGLSIARSLTSSLT